MFGEEKKIISVTSKTIEGAIVGGGVRPKVKTTGEVAWTPETLDEALKSILTKLKTDTVLLLLGEDIAYVTTLTIPKATPAAQERSAVYESIRYLIPEELNNWNWDYIITDGRRGSKSVLVFAPVMEKFQLLSNALHALGCKVLAVEPVLVAKLRNGDPYIGIAQKKDFKGEDSKTLNIELAAGITKKEKLVKESPVHETQPNKDIESKSSTGAYLTALIVVTILSVATIAGILYYRNQQSAMVATEVTPTPTLFTTSPTAEPTVTPSLDYAAYVVEVLNGSQTAGQAASVAAILEEAGFDDIETGNADRDNYTQTIIQVKESSESAFLIEKLTELLQDYEVATGEVLTATSSSDLLITVGDTN